MNLWVKFYRRAAHSLSELRQDTQYALRVLFHSPGFAVVGILSLGIGIGVCSVFFSELNSFVFRPLPAARDPKALFAIETPASYPYFERYRDEHGVVANAAAYMGPIPFAMGIEGASRNKTERVFGELVSPEYFSVVDVKPRAGRLFSPDIDKPGSAPVVVVSERFWRTHLDADPKAIGRTLRLNGQTATIVGVGPKDFLGVWPFTPADLFVPVTSGSTIAPELAGDTLARRDRKLFTIVVRLSPGVAQSAAGAALDSLTRHLDEEGHDIDRDRKGARVRLISAATALRLPPEAHGVMYAFMGVLMGLIMTLACTNLANLLLARASGRRKEIAIRLALGASRLRLVRQLLTESLLVALGGGVLGIVLAYGLARWFSTFKFPSPVPIDFNISPDLTVLAFAFALSVVAGLGFGLAPAMAATRADVAPALKEGALSPLSGYRRFGLRNLLVAYQVAASLTLLLITGFLVLGYNRTARMDVGLNLNGLYFLSLDPVRDGYSAAQTAAFFEKVPERFSNLGAVHSIAVSEMTPFASFISVANARFAAPKSDSDVKQIILSVVRERIGAGYFATLDVPMVRGREFNEQDQRVSPTSGAIQSAIINETAAREFFGSEDPIGRRIMADQSMLIDITGMSGDKPIATTSDRKNYMVIGVVRDIKTGFMASKAMSAVYIPLSVEDYRQAPVSGTTLVFRGDAGPDAITSVRGQIASIDSNLTIFNVRSMREQMDEMFSLIVFSEAIYGGIGIFGLILASVGLAGVTGYAVARRHKEIGIRMALGARSSQVLALVLKEGTVMVAVGSVLGFAGAFAISRGLSSVTSQFASAFASSVGDPILLIGAPVLLASLAMLACYVPARRSTKIDPLQALREE